MANSERNTIEPAQVELDADITDAERSHRKELHGKVMEQFEKRGNNYHSKDAPDFVAFVDHGNKITSGLDNDYVAQAMIRVGITKGWVAVQLSASKPFYALAEKAFETESYDPDLSPEAKPVPEKASADNEVERDTQKTSKQASALPESQPDDDTLDELAQHRIDIGQQVADQFRVSGSKYYFKDNAGHVNNLAFKVSGNSLRTSINTERVSKAIVMVAESRGWESIKVSGHPEFKRQVWLEASKRGIAVRGYTPDANDKAKLATYQESNLSNTVQRQSAAATKSRQNGAEPVKPVADSNAVRSYEGRLIEHGPAPYKNIASNKPSYFVTLQNDEGKQTVWGVDLQRSIEESGVSIGDQVNVEYKGRVPVTVKAGQREIATHRNEWQVSNIERQAVIEAVSRKVLDNTSLSEEDKERLQQGIKDRAEREAKSGPLPTVPVYDNAAPAKQVHADQLAKQNQAKTKSNTKSPELAR